MNKNYLSNFNSSFDIVCVARGQHVCCMTHRRFKFVEIIFNANLKIMRILVRIRIFIKRKKNGVTHAAIYTALNPNALVYINQTRAYIL